MSASEWAALVFCAILIGLAMAAWISVWPAYSSMIVRSSRADFAHLSVAFLIPFVCLLGFNLFLDCLTRKTRNVLREASEFKT